MRSKKNKIIISVIAFILVLTVGYAIFSENVTISGTAKAKGDFSLTAECQTGIKEGINAVDPSEEKGYENDSCTVTGTTISLKTDLKYPGAARYFTVKIKNTGSIDAEVDLVNAMEPITNKLCIDGYDFSQVGFTKEANGTIEESECVDDSDYERDFYGPFIEMSDAFAFETSDGAIINIEDEGASEFLTEDYHTILKPGTSLYVLFKLDFDSNWKQTNKDGSFLIKRENQFKFNFTQKTN